MHRPSLTRPHLDYLGLQGLRGAHPAGLEGPMRQLPAASHSPKPISTGRSALNGRLPAAMVLGSVYGRHVADNRQRKLDWEREELILAADLVARNGWRQIAATDPRVIELSALLRRLPLHPVHERRPEFRNVNSIARKTADIATNSPGHAGRATNSGAPTKRVITEFTARPKAMQDLAQSLRAAEARGDFAPLTQPVPEEYDGAEEGRLLIRRHVVYERDPGLRRRKVDEVRGAGNALACEVCGFDFERAYGERGSGYVECHHIVPLHAGGVGPRVTSDLALLCANCHRMIHVRAPWLTPTELLDLLRQQAVPAPG
jgi:5-methylcytosine-specific restriction protein A